MTKNKKTKENNLYIKLLLTLLVSGGLFILFLDRVPEPWNVISIFPAFYGGFIYSVIMRDVK